MWADVRVKRAKEGISWRGREVGERAALVPESSGINEYADHVLSMAKVERIWGTGEAEWEAPAGGVEVMDKAELWKRVSDFEDQMKTMQANLDCRLEWLEMVARQYMHRCQREETDARTKRREEQWYYRGWW